MRASCSRLKRNGRYTDKKREVRSTHLEKEAMSKALQAFIRDLEEILHTDTNNITSALIEQQGIFQSENIWLDRGAYFPISARQADSKNCLIRCLINKLRYISAKDYDQPLINLPANDDSKALSLNNSVNQAFIESNDSMKEQSASNLKCERMFNDLSPHKSDKSDKSDISQNQLLCECIQQTQKELEDAIKGAHSSSISPIDSSKKLKDFIEESECSSIGNNKDANMNISINMEGNKNSNVNIGKVNLFINCDPIIKKNGSFNIKSVPQSNQAATKPANHSFAEEKKSDKKAKHGNQSMIDCRKLPQKIKLQKRVMDKIKQYSKKAPKIVAKYKIRLNSEM